MSASHKRAHAFGSNPEPQKKSPLDHVLDFGQADHEEPLSPDALRRLQAILKQIEEINERIDRLATRL